MLQLLRNAIGNGGIEPSGALLLAGLYALFNTTIMPTVSSKIKSLFNYNGT